MSKFKLFGAVLVLSGLVLSAFGCQPATVTTPEITKAVAPTETAAPIQRYLSFSMVTQEFAYTAEGIAAVNRIIDIHEQYNVPLDIIVDDASMQVYAEQAPEVIERLKNSSVAAVSYHTRPPSPYYTKFDFAGLANLSETELYEQLLQYEDHGVDLVTGKPRSGPGGYQFVEDQIGYAPIMVSLITEPAFAPTLLQIYTEKGAQFVIEHRAEPIEPNQSRGNVMIRPETIPLIFTEHLDDSPEQLIAEQFSSAPAVTGPVFMSIKTHDNDFFATQSAWLSVYHNQAGRGTPLPPFDLSVHDQFAKLLPTEEQAARWTTYEAAVQYAAEHQTDFTLINAKRLQTVITQNGSTTSATATNTTANTTHSTKNANTGSNIFVTIVSHNEEPGGGQDYPNFLEDEAAFWEHRTAVINFAQQVTAAGAIYHWQSDWNFLEAVAKYDTGTTETNYKNVVRYLAEDLGVQIDPHAHERLYNYADVAYLIQQLGVEPSHVVGGFLVWPLEKSKLEYFWEPITSELDPTYTWQAEILWGGGSPNHQADYTVAGVWRPAGTDAYLTHSNTAPLPNIGNYTGTWIGLDDLLAKQAAGELDPNKIYTATIMVNQNDMLDSTLIDETVAQIEAHTDDVAADRLAWSTLEGIITTWETNFSSEPNIYQSELESSKASQLRKVNSNVSGQSNTFNKAKTDDGSCGDGICQPIEQKLNACAKDC